MVLRKWMARELKANLFRYGAIFLIVALCMAMVVAFANSADSVVGTIENYQEVDQVEDGEFTVYIPLSDAQIDELADKGVTLEETFYMDMDAQNDTSLRVFRNREEINKVHLDEGEAADAKGEIVLDKKFALREDLAVGDSITMGDDEYTITGLGSSPDYCYPLQSPSDVGIDMKFGIAWVDEDVFNTLKDTPKYGDGIQYNYGYLLGDEDGDMSAYDLKEYLMDLEYDLPAIATTYMGEYLEDMMGGIDLSEGIPEGIPEEALPEIDFVNLSFFLEAESNARIKTAVEDVAINKSGAAVAGVIFCVLIGYMLSAISVHTIERDSPAIGTLYSMGYSKGELLRHFIALPVWVVAAGAVLGTICGFLLTPYVAGNEGFVYPNLEIVYPPYLVAYGVVMPIVLAALINFLVLNHRLSAPPLNFLRGVKKQPKSKNVSLKRMSFIGSYRVRQVLREKRSYVILFVGLFISILVMMMGLCIYGSVKNYADHVADDINYNHMYMLKSPLSEQPENSEVGFSKNYTINFDMTGQDMSVILQGIDPDNEYFPFAEKLEPKEDADPDNNEVFMSSSARIKFGYQVGDTVTMTDKLEDEEYEFTIVGEVPFGNGLYFFMDLDSMRDYYDEDEDYYNTLFSNETLDVDSNILLSSIEKDSVVETANTWISNMMGMIIMLVAVSIIVFIIAMYLLTKIMLERSSFSISLLKVFGYTNREISKMYLGSNLYLVLLVMVVGLPLNKLIMNQIYPFFVSNMGTGMICYLHWPMFILAAAIIMISYLVTDALLRQKMKKVSLAEVLKNRE